MPEASREILIFGAEGDFCYAGNEPKGSSDGQNPASLEKCRKTCKKNHDFWGNSYETCVKLGKMKEAFCELATNFQNW